MKSMKCFLLIGLLALTAHAQVRTVRGTGGQVAQGSGKPSTNNYQLELHFTRGEKAARYVLGFSGGQVTTDLVDRLSEREEGTEPRTISFSASFTPFEEENGGEVAFHIARSIPYKTTARMPGPGNTREVVQFKSTGLTTKAALFFGKPVLLFDDGVERISVKLTKLEASLVEARNSCINNLRHLDGAKEQWALEQRATDGSPVNVAEVARYIGGGMPVCPEGGEYVMHPVGVPPECSIPTHSLTRSGGSL